VYAVIQTGGKQYKVKSGDTIKIEKVEAPVGSKVKIPNIILAFDEKNVQHEAKSLDKATVEGVVLLLFLLAIKKYRVMSSICRKKSP